MANVNGEGEAGFRLQLCRQSTLLRLEDNSQLGSSASGQRSLWEKIKHGPIAPIAPIITVYASSKLCEFIYEQFQTAFDPPIVLAINTDIDIEFLGIYNTGTFGFQQENHNSTKCFQRQGKKDWGDGYMVEDTKSKKVKRTST